MLSRGILALCFVIIGVWKRAESASVPIFHLARTGAAAIAIAEESSRIDETGIPAGLMRAKVREGVPPPLCAGSCVSPPTGPVCAFDARGTARTFTTLCELEAVSCRESTYYAIASMGEC